MKALGLRRSTTTLTKGLTIFGVAVGVLGLIEALLTWSQRFLR